MQAKTLAEGQPLSRKLMIFYGFPDLTHAIVALPMALFIPSYYADELALPMAQVGMALAASRILDLFIDPVVGVCSDRLQTRWGRRKPWLACGTPLLMLAAWMVFVPGASASVLYLLFWSCFLYFAYSLVDLPYKAWGAELSTNYAERSRVTAWREGFGFLGQIFFLATLMVMGFFGATDGRLQLLAIAIIVVVSQPVLVALSLWYVPERNPDFCAAPPSSIWRALALIGQNAAFWRSMIAIVLFAVAVLMQATLHRFVLKHVIGSPDVFAPMILAENVFTVVCLPLWIKISDRLGKHRTVSLAVLWMALWSLFFPLVGDGDTVFYVVLILLRGGSLAAIFFLSTSIAADVVDYDTVVSGKQRTGLYFSVWGIATKLAISLGVLLATALPAQFGFDPTHTSHPPATITALMAIYGWLAALIMALGVPFLWNFPIDSQRQQQLRAQIAAAKQENGGNPP
jgi:Na+/melibiose symporter-like transporter